MNDGDTSSKINSLNNIPRCVSCRRIIQADELFGAHGLCSQCLETECRGDGMGGE